MTETTCPSCDAPAPARASRCARCGYRFLEDGEAIRRPRPSRRGVVAALAACALAAVAVTSAVIARGGDDADEAAAIDSPQPIHLDILSRHPLSTPAAERALIERYLAIPDDDESDVRCGGREPRPAHSVRRCHILYPGGTDHTIRTVVVITTANGAEVLSEP